MSHISFGSLNEIIPNWFMNFFASRIFSPPMKHAKTGFFDFSKAFAVLRGSVIFCGVSKIIRKSLFSFSTVEIVFS